MSGYNLPPNSSGYNLPPGCFERDLPGYNDTEVECSNEECRAEITVDGNTTEVECEECGETWFAPEPDYDDDYDEEDYNEYYDIGGYDY